ncbi:hypothetical protein CRN84_12730 [Budvicia aquatica]|uniref:Uncharacterized protein n=1 Tax=Budvicia aquatica TaxID=82979 RepID=A0A2C6DG19_9GAMM|nr:hypothetical protein CRN84_12730 [Budvicia aquatica]
MGAPLPSTADSSQYGAGWLRDKEYLKEWVLRNSAGRVFPASTSNGNLTVGSTLTSQAVC